MLLAGAVEAGAWQIRLPSVPGFTNDRGSAVVVDPTGDVILVGASAGRFTAVSVSPLGIQTWRTEFDEILGAAAEGMRPVVTSNEDAIVGSTDPVPPNQTSIYRLAAASGMVIWTGTLAGVGDHLHSQMIAIDGADDVYAVGEFSADPQRLAVVKLDGGTGAESWRYTTPATPSLGEGQAITLDAGGDVVAAGWSDTDFEVVKLAASDGSEVWRYATATSLPAPVLDVAIGLAAEAGGDVFVAFTGHDGGGSAPSTLVRLDGTVGTELWRATPGGPPFVDRARVLVGPDAHPVVAHWRNCCFPAESIAKVDASTGAVLWQQNVNLGPIALDAQGDVVGLDLDLSVFGANHFIRMSGSSGTVLGTELVASGAGTSPALLEVGDVAAHPQGVVVTGQQSDGSRPAFVTIGAGGRLRGRKLVMRDPGEPGDRVFRLVVKDPWFALPLDGNSAAPSVSGATLEIENPLTAEAVSIALPAVNWTVKSSMVIGGTIYKYSDPAFASGPCKVVVLKGNRTFKAKCDGAAFGFTLDEASQGALNVRLSVPGGGGFARCVGFGGTIVVDEPGRLIAKDASPPAACVGDL